MIQNKITFLQPRVLIAANNDVYRTIMKKTFAVFLQYKMSKYSKV